MSGRDASSSTPRVSAPTTTTFCAASHFPAAMPSPGKRARAAISARWRGKGLYRFRGEFSEVETDEPDSRARKAPIQPDFRPNRWRLPASKHLERPEARFNTSGMLSQAGEKRRGGNIPQAWRVSATRDLGVNFLLWGGRSWPTIIRMAGSAGAGSFGGRSD